MRYIHVFLILGALLLAFGCTTNINSITLGKNTTVVSTNTSEVQYRSYETQNFTIMYLSEWSVMNNWVSVTIPNETEIDNYFGVMSWASSETLDDLVVYEKGYIGSSENITNVQKIKFKSYDAVSVESETTIGSYNSITRHRTVTYFKVGNRVYRVFYAIDKSREDTLNPLMDSVMQTFEPDGNAVAPAGHSTYSIPEFSFVYPSDWSLDKDPSVRFVSDKETPTDIVLEDAVVESWQGTDTLDNLAKSELQLGINTKDTLKGVTKFQFKGLNAEVVDYEGALYPGSVEQQHYRTYYFKKNDTIYRLGFVWESAPLNKQSKFEPISQKMLDSFVIK